MKQNSKKVKKIKLKIDEVSMVISLQDWILAKTNTGLISMALHFHCREFVKKLKEIPLSNELQ